MPDAADQILQEIDKEMDNLIDRIFELSQERLIDDGKVDTANLLKSGNISKRNFLDKEITYSAPYADSVEYGRLPGSMPPPDALINWVRRKLNVRSKNARNVAFAVALAIKRRGLEPTPYIRDSVHKVKKEYER